MNMYDQNPRSQWDEQVGMPYGYQHYAQADDMQAMGNTPMMQEDQTQAAFRRPGCACQQDPFCRRVQQCLRPTPWPPRPPQWPDCNKCQPDWDCRDDAFCKRVRRCIKADERPWEDCRRPIYPPVINCGCNCNRR